MSEATRRAVIGAVGVLAGTVVTKSVDVILDEPLSEGWGVFRAWIDKDRQLYEGMDKIDARKLRYVKRLFCSARMPVKLAGGHAHYLYPGQMHPDDKIACDVIEQYGRQLAEKYDVMATVPDYSVAGTFVCTGSPVSNERTRTFMEYSYVDNENPELGLRRNDSPRLRLPFEFALESTKLETLGDSRVPNWGISRKGEMISPDLRDAGVDYLVVSRLPNWTEKRRFLSGYDNSITVLAGAHGAGTAAVKLLLDNLEILERLDRIAHEFEYWQAIVRVEQVRRDLHPITGTMRSIPGRLSPNLVDYAAIQVMQ